MAEQEKCSLKILSASNLETFASSLKDSAGRAALSFWVIKSLFPFGPSKAALAMTHLDDIPAATPSSGDDDGGGYGGGAGCRTGNSPLYCNDATQLTS